MAYSDHLRYLALIPLSCALVSGTIFSLMEKPSTAIAEDNPPVSAPKISRVPDEDMNRILATLKQYNFNVSFSRPPQSKAYGLMQPQTKKIWIHPVTYPLGIAKQTLIHEAVHAAQSCQSNTLPVMPIGIDVPIAPLARRHFLRYHSYRRHVEAEALTVQGLPNGSDCVIQLLRDHC